MDFKKLIQKFKELGLNKQLTNIVIIILVGVLIIIAASVFKDTTTNTTTSGKQQNQTTNTTLSDENSDESESSNDDSAYENQQEAKLEGLLQNIQGVGNVKVMINYEKGEEEVPVYNESTSSSVINENDSSGGKRVTTQNSTGSNVVLTNNGDATKPFIVSKYKPKVSGVYIVAEGANDSDIKLNITDSVAEFFNISVDKVSVDAMKK